MWQEVQEPGPGLFPCLQDVCFPWLVFPGEDWLLTTGSDHTDFSESVEEIAPLTEEERKARLEELRQKLAEKRANQSVQDKEEAKRNEVGGRTMDQRFYSECLLSSSKYV